MSDPQLDVQVRGGPSVQGTYLPLAQVMDGVLGSTPGVSPVRDAVQGWIAEFVPTQYSLVFNVPGTLSAANDVAPWVIVPAAYSVLPRCRMAIKTMPTVATGVNIDIKISTDHGASFLSIFASTPTIGPLGGNEIIIPTVDFSQVNFNSGDILRLDILTVGDTVAGADLMILLNGTVQV